MTEYIHIVYKGTSVPFSEWSLTELVKVLLPGCKTVSTSTGPEMPAEDSSLGLIAHLFYNNGKGASLFFSVDTLYRFGVYAAPQKKGIDLIISLPHHFLNKKIGEKVASDLIRRSKTVYDLLQPEYAIGDWEETVDKRGTSRREVFWLNFYGPPLVQKIGKEKIASTPYGTVEDLANGGILLVRGKTPDVNSEHKEAIKKHLFGERSPLDRFLGR